MVGGLIPNFATRDADRSFQKRRMLNQAIILTDRNLQSTEQRKIRSFKLSPQKRRSIGRQEHRPKTSLRPQPAESARANPEKYPNTLQEAIFTYSLINEVVFMILGQAIDAKSCTSLWARGRQRLCHNVQLFLHNGAHVCFYYCPDMTILGHYIKIINLNL